MPLPGIEQILNAPTYVRPETHRGAPVSPAPAPRPTSPLAVDEQILLTLQQLLALFKNQEAQVLTTQNIPRTGSAYLHVLVYNQKDTPVQGPTVAVPGNFDVGVRARQTNTGTAYVGFTQTGVLADLYRTELPAGNSVSVPVSNLKYIWFYSTAIGDKVELLAPQ